jgi:hypothetical protein
MESVAPSQLSSITSSISQQLTRLGRPACNSQFSSNYLLYYLLHHSTHISSAALVISLDSAAELE